MEQHLSSGVPIRTCNSTGCTFLGRERLAGGSGGREGPGEPLAQPGQQHQGGRGRLHTPRLSLGDEQSEAALRTHPATHETISYDLGKLVCFSQKPIENKQDKSLHKMHFKPEGCTS